MDVISIEAEMVNVATTSHFCLQRHLFLFHNYLFVAQIFLQWFLDIKQSYYLIIKKLSIN